MHLHALQLLQQRPAQQQPAPEIVLRDIHRLPAPALWPPAPGWWLLLVALLLLAAGIGWWLRRRRAQRRAIEHIFDQAILEAGDGPAQVAAISALLRRAARRQHPHADALEGDDWLALLDEGLPIAFFQTTVGRSLLDGGYRPAIDAADVTALREHGRARFLRWMGVRG